MQLQAEVWQEKLVLFSLAQSESVQKAWLSKALNPTKQEAGRLGEVEPQRTNTSVT
jgi:hypothetical protein